jgi:hypothetical protein
VESDPLMKNADISAAAGLLGARLRRLAELSGEKTPSTLVSAIEASPADQVEVALAGWERLMSPEVQWPALVDDLTAAKNLRQAIESRVSKGVSEAPRRDELLGAVRDGFVRRWNAFAAQSFDATKGDTAARAEIMQRTLEAADGFGVSEGRMTDARVRYNFLLHRLNQQIAAADDASAAAAAAGFVAGAKGLPPEFQSREPVAKLIQAMTKLSEPRAPEPAGPDPKSLGPATKSLPATSEKDDNLLTFDLGGVPLRFVRIEFDRPGAGTDVVYLGESEVSLDVFTRLVERTPQRWGGFRGLLNVPEDEEGWYGPRGWVWPRDGAIKEGSFWLDAQSPYTSRDGAPAYDPALGGETSGSVTGRRLKDEFGGKPTARHPMHRTTPGAAMTAAAAVGCRLPTVAEWQAAYKRFGQADESVWNLRDATFQKQYDYALRVQQSHASQRSFLDFYALPDRFSYAPGKPGSAPYATDDHTLWFRPVDADTQVLHNLVGNVAELVVADEGSRDRTGDAVPVAIIGGSALSGRSAAVDVPWPLTADKRNEAYADVGFRLAFSATGSRSKSVPVAKLIAERIGKNPFVLE